MNIKTRSLIRILAVSSVSIILGLAFLSVIPVFAATIFEDGFETGDFSRWDVVSGPPTVTSGDAYHGTYKAVLDAAGEYAQARFTLAPRDHVFMRAYVMFKSIPASGTQTTVLGVYNNTGGQYMAEARVANVAGTVKWALRYWHNGTHYIAISEQQRPILDTWYCVEVEGKSGSATNAESRIYINGVELTDISQTEKNNPYQINCGYIWANTAVTRWYDDVVINENYIGPEYIVVYKGFFYDGFETGDFSKWSPVVGAPTLASGDAHHGAYKAILTTEGQYVQKWFTPRDHVFMRAYVRFESFPESGQETTVLGVYTSGIYMAEARVRNVGGTVKWALRYYDGSHYTHYTAVSELEKPVLGRWYSVEVEGISHTTTGAESRIYIDGSELTDVSRTGLNNNYQINCGYLWANTSVTRWYDCVVIDWAYIGPEPVAVNDEYTTDEDTPVSGDLAGNDTPGGGSNVWALVTGNGPAHGELTLAEDGTFTYTPGPEYYGLDGFTYTITDARGDVSEATVNITVSPVDDVPVAVDDSFNATEDVLVTGGNVLTNATGLGDGGITVTQVGTLPGLTLSSDGSFTYRNPSPDFNGMVSFRYQVCDVDHECSTATATINVAPVNDPPVARDDAATITSGVTVEIDVMDNDSAGPANEDQTLTLGAVSDPQYGTAVTNPDGTVAYTPDPEFIGIDTLTYTVCDNDGACDTATVRVTVVPKGELTDSMWCPLPDNQFRLLNRIEVAPNIYRLQASNPGQFYYNGFYSGEPGENFTMTMEIPYPFVTQEGAGVPIQVHDGTGLTSRGCFTPTPSLNGFTIETQAMSPVSSAGNQIITPEDYQIKQLGEFTTVTISGTVPSTGLAYVTIHLDYGLKKTGGWRPTGTTTVNPETGVKIADVSNGTITIHGYEEYEFSREVGGDNFETTPVSYNEFKKFAGFMGFVTNKDTEEPMAKLKVVIYNPKGGVLATVYTDADGYYMYPYKHTAKAATYTVKLPEYKLSTAVTVKANGFAGVDFEIP